MSSTTCRRGRWPTSPTPGAGGRAQVPQPRRLSSEGLSLRRVATTGTHLSPRRVLRRTRMPPAAAMRGLQSVRGGGRRGSRARGSARSSFRCLASALYGKPPAREPAGEGESTSSPRIARGRRPGDRRPAQPVSRRAHGRVHVPALSTVYGPRQRPDGGVVGRFAGTPCAANSPLIHGDGRQTRDLLYVDDAVDALVRAGPSTAVDSSSTSARAAARRSATCGR